MEDCGGNTEGVPISEHMETTTMFSGGQTSRSELFSIGIMPTLYLLLIPVVILIVMKCRRRKRSESKLP